MRGQLLFEAVARWARALPAEYCGQKRHIDQRFCGTAVGDIGPVEAKLRTFDPVRGLVFGAWGEASPDVERLLTAFCQSGAARYWHSMRVASPDAAQGILAWMLQRRWGMTAQREAARLELERLEYVGHGAVAAADRRLATASSAAAAARRAACSFWQGPRLPFGGAGRCQVSCILFCPGRAPSWARRVRPFACWVFSGPWGETAAADLLWRCARRCECTE